MCLASICLKQADIAKAISFFDVGTTLKCLECGVGTKLCQQNFVVGKFTTHVIVENNIPLNMIINISCTLVDNQIPWDDIFDYHPLRECYIYIISL